MDSSNCSSSLVVQDIVAANGGTDVALLIVEVGIVVLRDFMSEMSLHACDLSFHSSVKFTFERGDGLARSWIDHILCS